MAILDHTPTCGSAPFGKICDFEPPVKKNFENLDIHVADNDVPKEKNN